MKIGAADASCRIVHVTLARREGEIFRAVETLKISGLQTPNEPAVAEAELEPGDYHVVNYDCFTPRGRVGLTSMKSPGLYAKSLASFSIGAGEVVNVGFLKLAPIGVTNQVFSRTLHWAIAVTDWPLSELENFKQRRPTLYAAMRTRLMIVPKAEPMTAEKRDEACAKAKQLKEEGKVQNLPLGCSPSGKAEPIVPAKADKPKKKIDA